MNPQNGQELTLKDIAKDLSKEVEACDAQACETFTGFTYGSTPLSIRTHYAHFVSRHEGCDRFKTLNYLQDLSNFVDLLGFVLFVYLLHLRFSLGQSMVITTILFVVPFTTIWILILTDCI
jgi:hypothetical protein